MTLTLTVDQFRLVADILSGALENLDCDEDARAETLRPVVHECNVRQAETEARAAYVKAGES